MSAVTKVNIIIWLTVFAVLCIEITCLQGWVVGLKSIVMWLMVGYFLGDIYIATVHFEIDNFKPDDNGYKHHLVIAKYGFKYERLLGHNPYREKNVTSIYQANPDPLLDSGCCYPQCCYPKKDDNDCSDQRDICSRHIEDQDNKLNGESSCCYPKCCYPKNRSPGKNNDCLDGELHQSLPEKTRSLRSIKDLHSVVLSAFYKLFHAVQVSLVSDKQVSIFDQKSLLVCTMPVLLFCFGFPPAISLVYPVICILSEISGSGSPDYYAHHYESAPKIVKYAQQLHLMMKPSSHEKHHRNPTMGYAYFSPITNLVLDNSNYWPLVKAAMERSKNMKAVPVPVPLLDE